MKLNFASIFNWKTIFILSLIIGAIIRIYYVNNSVKYLLWDTLTHQDIAWRFHKGELAVDARDKTVGYPMFLYSIYSLVGMEGLSTVKYIQAAIDLVNGILIYFIGKRIFNLVSARISMVLYLLNPLTASYVGLLFAEILTIFVLLLVLLVITDKKFMSKPIIWALFGFLMGILVFIRLQFSIVCFVTIFLFSIYYFKNKFKLFFFIIVISGFVLANSYTLFGNWYKFKVITIMPPYSWGISAFYLNFYNDFDSPVLYDVNKNDEFFNKIPSEYWAIYRKFYELSDSQIVEFRNTYTRLLFQRLQYEWPQFIIISFKNILRMWDKWQLSYYEDQFYPADSIPVRIYNILLLILAIIGIFSNLKEKLFKVKINSILFFTIINILYSIFFLSMITNQPRHTLTFYAFVFIWSGYGLFKVLKFIKK